MPRTTSIAKPRPFSKFAGPTEAQQNSILMSMPAEIRNEIYDMVFEDTIIHIAKQTGAPRIRKPAQQAPGLLLSCLQTHDEAIKIYYSSTMFDFGCVRRLSAWTRKIGSLRRKAVRHVRLPSPRPTAAALFSPQAMQDMAQDTGKQLAAAAAKTRLPQGALRMDICLPGDEGELERTWSPDPVETTKSFLDGATDEQIAMQPRVVAFLLEAKRRAFPLRV